MGDKEQMGRLAFREEGTMWNAYYALPNTMEKALLLGSLQINIAKKSPERKEAFITLMRDVIADIFEERCGVRPDWCDPQPAPEHERSGKA